MFINISTCVCLNMKTCRIVNIQLYFSVYKNMFMNKNVYLNRKKFTWSLLYMKFLSISAFIFWYGNIWTKCVLFFHLENMLIVRFTCNILSDCHHFVLQVGLKAYFWLTVHTGENTCQFVLYWRFSKHYVMARIVSVCEQGLKHEFQRREVPVEVDDMKVCLFSYF